MDFLAFANFHAKFAEHKICTCHPEFAQLQFAPAVGQHDQFLSPQKSSLDNAFRGEKNYTAVEREIDKRDLASENRIIILQASGHFYELQLQTILSNYELSMPTTIKFKLSYSFYYLI